ncbi:MAG: hypothetical protein BWY72_00565 [Bacteroidetes bacterium ADurb.Bin416]|nr:MAG: hypothetical protein BWY72_00565 [Bacteroidetes bacterium ADurb.Bin416]
MRSELDAARVIRFTTRLDNNFKNQATAIIKATLIPLVRSQSTRLCQKVVTVVASMSVNWVTKVVESVERVVESVMTV